MPVFKYETLIFHYTNNEKGET